MKYINLKDVICPGDLVSYGSTKAAYSLDDIGRSLGAEIPCTARVVAVYRDFVITQLRVVQDCANRWNIKAVNGDVNWWRGGRDYVDCI